MDLLTSSPLALIEQINESIPQKNPLKSFTILASDQEKVWVDTMITQICNNFDNALASSQVNVSLITESVITLLLLSFHSDSSISTKVHDAVKNNIHNSLLALYSAAINLEEDNTQASDAAFKKLKSLSIHPVFTQFDHLFCIRALVPKN